MDSFITIKWKEYREAESAGKTTLMWAIKRGIEKVEAYLLKEKPINSQLTLF